MSLSPKQINVITRLQKYGDIVTQSQIKEEFANDGRGSFPWWFLSEQFRVSHGKYSTHIPAGTTKVNVVPEPEAAIANIIPMVVMQKRITNKHGSVDFDNLVPERFKNFVPFGNFPDIKTIIASRKFFPIYITGPSGNGKSLSVQEACAQLKREYIRVQITGETDEDDLIGGYRLIDGETVWFDGPIVIAAQKGAVLLLDEIDYGTGKISCLQNVLEGKGIYIKKVNKFVPITPGFTIVATANTKGRGSEENGGRYVNTNIMNEAFLERFLVTMEQAYPAANIEQKILNKELESLSSDDPEFAENLCKWAEIIRRTYDEDGIDDVISTRRLVHIVNAYSVFKDKIKSIKLCIARFDADTQQGFIDLWDKIQAGPEVMNNEETASDANKEVNVF